MEEAYARSIEKDNLLKMIAALGLRFDAPRQTTVASAETAGSGSPVKSRQGIVNMYLENLQKDPENAELLNNVAWILATVDNPDAGTIEQALTMAEKAKTLTAGQNAGVLDTLGAAYAQGGWFDMALSAARSGLKLACANKQTELAAALKRRIELYEKGTPVRE